MPVAHKEVGWAIAAAHACDDKELQAVRRLQRRLAASGLLEVLGCTHGCGELRGCDQLCAISSDKNLLAGVHSCVHMCEYALRALPNAEALRGLELSLPFP